jgi:hypothetical protein
MAGPQASALHHLAGVDRQHAGLGAEDDPVVLGEQPTPRAQPVAVEGGDEAAPVRGDDRSGPIPRLEHRGVVAVEAVELVRKLEIRFMRHRDQHHQRMLERAAVADQELEQVIEGG